MRLQRPSTFSFLLPLRPKQKNQKIHQGRSWFGRGKGGTWRTSERVASAHLLKGLQLCLADRGMIWISASLWAWLDRGRGSERKNFAGMERTLFAISSQRKPSKGQKRGKSKGGSMPFRSSVPSTIYDPSMGEVVILLLYFNDWLTPYCISKCTCRFTASSIVTFLVGEESKRIWTLSPTGWLNLHQGYRTGSPLFCSPFALFLLIFQPPVAKGVVSVRYLLNLSFCLTDQVM